MLASHYRIVIQRAIKWVLRAWYVTRVVTVRHIYIVLLNVKHHFVVPEMSYKNKTLHNHKRHENTHVTASTVHTGHEHETHRYHHHWGVDGWHT